MAQRSLALLVSAAICCSLAAPAAAGRHLSALPPSSAPSECFVGVTDKTNNASLCVWVVSGVSDTACRTPPAGQPAGQQFPIFETSTALCTLPIPYACSSLSASGAAAGTTKCSDTVSQTVLAILKKGAETDTDNRALSTNGNALSNGGHLTSAAGTKLAHTGTSAAPAPARSSPTPSPAHTSTPSSPTSTPSNQRPTPAVVRTPSGPSSVNPRTGSVPGLQVPAWG